MQVRAASRCDEPVVCYTDVECINARGEVTAEFEIPQPAREELLREVIVSGPISMAADSLLYDRRCVEGVGPYDESQPYTQDADRLIRLARRFPFLRVRQ